MRTRWQLGIFLCLSLFILSAIDCFAGDPLQDVLNEKEWTVLATPRADIVVGTIVQETGKLRQEVLREAEFCFPDLNQYVETSPFTLWELEKERRLSIGAAAKWFLPGLPLQIISWLKGGTAREVSVIISNLTIHSVAVGRIDDLIPQLKAECSEYLLRRKHPGVVLITVLRAREIRYQFYGEDGLAIDLSAHEEEIEKSAWLGYRYEVRENTRLIAMQPVTIAYKGARVAREGIVPQFEGEPTKHLTTAPLLRWKDEDGQRLLEAVEAEEAEVRSFLERLLESVGKAAVYRFEIYETKCLPNFDSCPDQNFVGYFEIGIIEMRLENGKPDIRLHLALEIQGSGRTVIQGSEQQETISMAVGDRPEDFGSVSQDDLRRARLEVRKLFGMEAEADEEGIVYVGRELVEVPMGSFDCDVYRVSFEREGEKAGETVYYLSQDVVPLLLVKVEIFDLRPPSVFMGKSGHGIWLGPRAQGVESVNARVVLDKVVPIQALPTR